MTTLNATTDVDESLEVDLEFGATGSIYPAPNLPPVEGDGWWRRSYVFPEPTIVNGQPVDWEYDPELSTEEYIGQLQVVVDGRDVSMFRDVPTIVKEWGSDEPGGDGPAAIVFPSITVHDHAGSGDLAWLRDRAHVVLRRVHPTLPAKTLWTGLTNVGATSADDNQSGFEVQLIGVLYQADDAVQLPGYDINERDIGYLIRLALDTVISRDYQLTPVVLTGIGSRKRGSGTPRLTGYVFDLLADGTAANGVDQWTVTNSSWHPLVRLKDRTTVHATMRAGQPGMQNRLRGDISTGVKVIYGEGTRSDGMRWRNTKYPNLRLDDAPVFPLDPDDEFTPGGADAGFAAFATEMREAGYRMYSGDTYNGNDEAEVRDAQRIAGVPVTGNVGATTWATIFGVGTNVGSRASAFQAPLASITQVEPYLYDARGRRLGRNPAYNPNIPRIERYEVMGEGIDLAHGRSSARRELDRTNQHVQFGEIVLTADPNEMSRFDLRAGMNFLLQGHHGIDRMLHIASVRVGWEQPDQPVTLTVDVLNRDILTLTQMIQRNRESATDPTRRPSSQRRRSREIIDTYTIWDGESGAGRIPRHAVAGGEWLVLRIPAGQVGSLSHIYLRTSSDACEFAVGFFGQPVTAAQLQQLIGNPLAADKPWNLNFDRLQALGMFAAWGGETQPAGYSPGLKSDGDAFTGKLIDNGSVDYFTVQPGWIWVAEYAAEGCYIDGQIDAAPEGL